MIVARTMILAGALVFLTGAVGLSRAAADDLPHLSLSQSELNELLPEGPEPRSVPNERADTIDSIPTDRRSTTVAPSSGQRPAPQSFSSLDRDPPSLSRSYSFGGNTVTPYIGAGFGSGYISELDRSLNRPQPPVTDMSVRNLLGPNMVPNEVRLGIRIPF